MTEAQNYQVTVARWLISFFEDPDADVPHSTIKKTALQKTPLENTSIYDPKKTSNPSCQFATKSQNERRCASGGSKKAVQFFLTHSLWHVCPSLSQEFSASAAKIRRPSVVQRPEAQVSSISREVEDQTSTQLLFTNTKDRVNEITPAHTSSDGERQATHTRHVDQGVHNPKKL